MKKFGTLLREERSKAGVSLGNMARHLQMRVSHLSDIELLRRAPLSPERIRKAGELMPKTDIKHMLLAAAVQKGHFELETENVTPRAREVVAALARELPVLTEVQLAGIEKIVSPFVSPKDEEE